MNNIKWNSCSEGQPEIGDGYLVVWDITDGRPPVVSSFDWDCVSEVWSDPRNNNMPMNHAVLMWAELPKPPKEIKL